MGRVYDAEGIAPTINTCGGGGREPKIAALRGRNPDNPSERGKSNGNYKQRLEMNENGTSNTLTSVQKDNLVVEPSVINPLKGQTDNGWHYEQQVYDQEGLTRAVKAGGGSGNIPKVIEDDWKSVVGNKQMNPFRGSVDGESPCITSACGAGGGMTPMVTDADVETTKTKEFIEQVRGHEEMRYRIRKLTPRECFRLMGVDDKDIDTIQAAGISNSQQYKMAGNSIVVDVLYYQFFKAFIDRTPTEPFCQQTLF